MRARTIFRLLVAIALVGGGLALVERMQKRHGRDPRGQPVLRDMAWDRVHHLSLDFGSHRMECVRSNAGWELRFPLMAPADEGRMECILSALQAMRIYDAVTARQRESRLLSLADFGLEPPRVRIALRDGVRTRYLRIGQDVPLGKGLFVWLESEPDVWVVGPAVAEALPAKAEDLRARRVFQGETARTTRLEIQRPGVGFLQLVRQGGKWRLQQPFYARVDTARVHLILDTLYSVEVERFVWDAPPPVPGGSAPSPALAMAPDRLAVLESSYGLAPDEAVRLTVWQEGQELSQELRLGKSVPDKPNSLYAKIRDIPSVYQVSRTILETVSVTPNELRDRNLFFVDPRDVRVIGLQKGDQKLVLRRQPDTSWVLSEPVEWPADGPTVGDLLRRITALRVEAFADGTETNLAALGLAAPVLILHVLKNEPHGTETEASSPASFLSEGQEDRLLIGQTAGTPRRFFARFERDGIRFGEGATVYELAPAAVMDLGPDLTDPLRFRDRHMLAVLPQNIKRIHWTLETGEAIVTQDPSSATWTLVHPPGSVLLKDALDDFLLAVAALRADRIECHNPKDLSGYGLATPAARITLTLSETEGLQKSLFIGAPAGAWGRFVLIQGQDVVFALSDDVVKRLIRSPLSASNTPPSKVSATNSSSSVARRVP